MRMALPWDITKLSGQPHSIFLVCLLDVYYLFKALNPIVHIKLYLWGTSGSHTHCLTLTSMFRQANGYVNIEFDILKKVHIIKQCYDQRYWAIIGVNLLLSGTYRIHKASSVLLKSAVYVWAKELSYFAKLISL